MFRLLGSLIDWIVKTSLKTILIAVVLFVLIGVVGAIVGGGKNPPPATAPRHAAKPAASVTPAVPAAAQPAPAVAKILDVPAILAAKLEDVRRLIQDTKPIRRNADPSPLDGSLDTVEFAAPGCSGFLGVTNGVVTSVVVMWDSETRPVTPTPDTEFAMTGIDPASVQHDPGRSAPAFRAYTGTVNGRRVILYGVEPAMGWMVFRAVDARYAR